ncbi:MAG TPA: transposase, partial [Thermoanaerobaculia bacterium]
MAADRDYLRAMVQELVQDVMEAEMAEAVGAGRYERSAERRSLRSGYYGRNLITRVGTLELRV